MAGGGTGEQGTNCMDRLTIAANHPPDIALAQLQFEDGRLAAGNFRVMSSGYSTSCRMMNSRNSFTVFGTDFLRPAVTPFAPVVMAAY